LLTLASSRSDSAIYRLHPQGSRMIRLTHGQGQYSNPAWSPDGGWIAYQGNSPSNRRMTVYRMDREGGRSQALTPSDYQGFFPAWSPDGQWIAFASHVSGDNFQLFRIRADGRERQSLGFAFHSALQWSPDQGYLVFNVRVNYSGDFEIYRLNLEDGITRRLSSGVGVNVSPTVDPTGQWIAFASSRNGKMDIYRMRPDGSQAQPLTDLAGDSGYPVWSPDGQTLAFINRHEGGSRLYEWRAGQVRPLSATYGHIVSPIWSPTFQRGWTGAPLLGLLAGIAVLILVALGGGQVQKRVPAGSRPKPPVL
jgi:TolB protein